jgi:hypothetical protein
VGSLDNLPFNSLDCLDNEEWSERGSDVCREECDMPVSGLGEEDLAHLSLATNEMAKGLWGGEKSRILGGEVGEEEEQYSEGEECSAGSEVSQEEWDMPVPGLEEEDMAHLSLATSEM